MSVELKNTMSSLLQEVNEIKEQEDLQAKLDSLYSQIQRWIRKFEQLL